MSLKTATSINELYYKLQSRHKNLGARMKLFPLYHRASATGHVATCSQGEQGQKVSSGYMDSTF